MMRRQRPWLSDRLAVGCQRIYSKLGTGAALHLAAQLAGLAGVLKDFVQLLRHLCSSTAGGLLERVTACTEGTLQGCTLHVHARESIGACAGSLTEGLY